MSRTSETAQHSEGFETALPQRRSAIISGLTRWAAAAALSTVAAGCQTHPTSGQGFYGGYMPGADASSGKTDGSSYYSKTGETCETPVQHMVEADQPFTIFSSTTTGIQKFSGGAVQMTPAKVKNGKNPYYHTEDLQPQLAKSGETNKFHLLVTVHPTGAPTHQISKTQSVKGNGEQDNAPGIYIKLDTTLSPEQVVQMMVNATEVLMPLHGYKSLLEARASIEQHLRQKYPSMIRSYRAGDPSKHNAEDKNPATGMTVLAITFLEPVCQ